MCNRVCVCVDGLVCVSVCMPRWMCVCVCNRVCVCVDGLVCVSVCMPIWMCVCNRVCVWMDWYV